MPKKDKTFKPMAKKEVDAGLKKQAEKRRQNFTEFVKHVKKGLGVDLTDAWEKYLNKPTMDEVKFCEVAEDRIGEAGHYTYNSDTRFEVYHKADVEQWIQDGNFPDALEDYLPDDSNQFSMEPEDLDSTYAMWFEDWDNGYGEADESVSEMAFEPGRGDIVHPSKKDWIETGDEKINALLPTLSDEEQTYLEKIASTGYQQLVQKIENYTGIRVGRTAFPALVRLLFGSLAEAKQIENAHKEDLEALAVNMVLSQEEFEMAQISIKNGTLKIDAKLGAAELANLTGEGEEEPEEAPEGELSEDEKMNLELAGLWDSLNDAALRRKFANLMTTGGAVNKLYMFHMAEDELNQIDPRLIRLYGILSSVTQLGYWITPFGIEQAAAQGGDTAGGSEEVIPEGDTYTIKARGTTFPFLVHEIVKGVYEWLSLDPEMQREMEKETVEDETTDVIAGPEIYKAVAGYLGADEQNLLPLVKKMLLQLKGDELKEILAKSEQGQKLMRDIISQAKEGFGEYKRSQI